MSSPAQQLSNLAMQEPAGRWRRRLLVLFWALMAMLSAAAIAAWSALNSLISMPLL